MRHGTGRYNSGCRCVTCVESHRAYHRAYATQHRERIREYSRATYARYRERIRAAQLMRRHRDRDHVNAQNRASAARWREHHRHRGRMYYVTNRDRIRARHREYHQQTRLAAATRQAVRRALMRHAPGIASEMQLLARVAYYGGRCWMCKAPADTIDHVIPLARGGSNWPANLRPACKPCNCRKGARTA